MAEQAEMTHETDEERENRDKPFWEQYRSFHAAFAQFCYTSAQGKYILSSELFYHHLVFQQWQSRDASSIT
jgi:hypothetical protein